MDNPRKETIKLVDKFKLQENYEASWAVDVNTTGITPDRTELKSKIYTQFDVDVDVMHEEVPAEIGTVLYDKNDEIVDINLEDWVVEEYSL